jgi:hypothetical protein
VTPRAGLSAVLATDTWESAAATARHLSRQSRAGEVELVLVARPGEVRIPDTAGASLAAIRLVEEPDALRGLARARAAGVRAATAPIVVFAETHSFPEPGWADALLRAFDGEDVVAVGPSVVNANPDTLRSWVAILIDYGPWLHPVEPREGCELPGHNSAFRRDALLARGGRLAEALRSDMLLASELWRAGHRVRIEPEARTAHVNVTRPASWTRERVGAGRVFAAARCAGWPRGRRAAFAAGAPLIPFVRLRRILADLRRIRPIGAPGRAVLPLLGAGLALSALGEALGYAAGAGRAAAVAEEMELHRLAHVRRAERGRW